MGTECSMTKTKAFVIKQIVLVFFLFRKTIFLCHKNYLKKLLCNKNNRCDKYLLRDGWNNI
jgi:hypothetical protein